MNIESIRRELADVERELAERTKLLKSVSALEGMRDRLLRELADNEGAHDRRFVPVR